jgi:DNA-binding response OmpR family regulator
MKVLVIEDDIQLNTTIKKFLELNNYEVQTVLDGKKALDTIQDSKFDLYVVDINIPNINGLEFIKHIREYDKESAIIMITASLDIDDFTKAYEYGCNDYIKKPFHLKELDVRIKKLFDDKEILKINDYMSYNFKYQELTINGKVVHLRKKTNKLLQILLKNLNHTVKTEEIIKYVWADEKKENYPLRQLTADLRKELNTKKEHIISVFGVGYRFEA